MYNDDEDLSTLADLALIFDSPMMRTMSSEVVDIETHTKLVAIAANEEEGLSRSA